MNEPSLLDVLKTFLNRRLVLRGILFLLGGALIYKGVASLLAPTGEMLVPLGLIGIGVMLVVNAWFIRPAEMPAVTLPAMRFQPSPALAGGGQRWAPVLFSRVVRWTSFPTALALIFLGTRSLQVTHLTSHPSPLPGLLLVGLGLGLALMAVWYGKMEWIATPAPVPARLGALRVRWRVAAAAFVLSVVTFLTVPENQFTLIGAVAWGLSLVVWLAAFWDGPLFSPFDWRGALARLWHEGVQVRLSRTAWLLGGVMVVAAFFCFARLNEVPSEMTSDHVEKLLDVNRILNLGDRPIFEPANGGREPLAFYLMALTARLAGTGLTPLTLKLVSASVAFLTIPLIFLLAREITEDDTTGLLAALLASMAWWPTILGRLGLRLPTAPLFVTLALWLLVRGLKRQQRNPVLLAGLAIGIGLYSYTPVRIVPLAVALAFGLYVLHTGRPGAAPGASWRERLASLVRSSRGWVGPTAQTAVWLGMVGVVILASFVPMLRYSVDRPDEFWLRTRTRIVGDYGDVSTPTWTALWRNEWNSLTMFFWTSDQAWIIAPSGQPALDWVTGGLFLLGAAFLAYRYLRWRHWLDLFLLLSIPVLLLPSTLALAFGGRENPSMSRSCAAIPVVFTVAAMALRLLLTHGRRVMGGRVGVAANVCLAGFLLVVAGQNNWRIIFEDYAKAYTLSAQNASEMGEVVRGFAESVGSYDMAFVRAYPYWVDARAVGIYAGNFGWENAVMQPEDFSRMAADPRPKLFLLNRMDYKERPDGQTPSLTDLRRIYPNGRLTLYTSKIPYHDFLIYFVPGTADLSDSQLPTQ